MIQIPKVQHDLEILSVSDGASAVLVARRCSHCEVWYPATRVYFYSSGPQGRYLMSRCKACNLQAHALRNARRRQTSSPDEREMFRAKQRIYLYAYRRRRPKRIYTDKDRHLRREWWKANRDSLRARSRAWNHANPEKMRLSVERYRARKKELPDTLTMQQWESIKIAYDGCCAYCGVRPEKLTQDHVIPLIAGGGTVADNIVPACQPCNSSKGIRPSVYASMSKLL